MSCPYGLGSITGYCNARYRCRCTECRAAHAAHQRGYSRRRGYAGGALLSRVNQETARRARYQVDALNDMGYTLNTIAEAAGLSPGFLSNLRRNRRPSKATAVKIQHAWDTLTGRGHGYDKNPLAGHGRRPLREED